MKPPTHIHYIVCAYERVEPGTGNYVDNTAVDVLADNEDEAIEKAKGLVSKPNYCVRTIIEHLSGQPCSRG